MVSYMRITRPSVKPGYTVRLVLHPQPRQREVLFWWKDQALFLNYFSLKMRPTSRLEIFG